MIKLFSILLLIFTFPNHPAFSSHSIFDLAFEIAEEYKGFKGHHIPNLSEQPCLAVQFVTFLKEDFKNNKDDKTAKKISMIIGQGIGVGGISDRMATKEEENLIFSAICTIADGRTNSPERHCLLFADMSPEQQTTTFIQDNLSRVSSINYYGYQNPNHSNHLLVCKAAYDAAIQSRSILSSFDFAKDKSSLKYFRKGVLYNLILAQNVSYPSKENFRKVKSLAKDGYIPAQSEVSLVYQRGWNKFNFQIDFSRSKAIKWLKKDDKYKTEPDIQYKLACLYIESTGTSFTEYKEAFRLLKKAAKQGFNRAFFKIADCYTVGFGVPKDDLKAIKWCEKGVAAYSLSSICKFKLLNALAKLGSYYEEGKAVEQNYAKAIEFYEKAIKIFNDENFRGASSVYFDVIRDLAALYKKGKGVEKNYTKAIEIYEKTTNSNREVDCYSYNTCLFKLASCYKKGKGVKKDLDRASAIYLKLTKKIYRKDYEKLISHLLNLASLYKKDTKTDKNLEKTSLIYKKVSDLNHNLAQYFIHIKYGGLRPSYESQQIPNYYELASLYKKYTQSQNTFLQTLEENVPDVLSVKIHENEFHKWGFLTAFDESSTTS